MKFQAGFCPNEARTLLSPCSYPDQLEEKDKTESSALIKKKVE